MFSNKTVKPLTPAGIGPTYSWETHAAMSQMLWVVVKRFDYKLFPSMRDHPRRIFRSMRDHPRRIFQWEGITYQKGFNGVSVQGNVETYDPEDLPRDAYWKNAPSIYEGCGSLCGGDEDVWDGAFFALDLFCRPDVFAEVAQVFALGVGPQRGGLSLHIHITNPDLQPGEHDYWHTRWRRDHWQVVAWEMFSGANVEGYTPR